MRKEDRAEGFHPFSLFAEGRKNDTFNWGPVEPKEFARTPMWDVSVEHERGDVGPGFHGAKAKTTHTSVLLVHIFLSWTIN